MARVALALAVVIAAPALAGAQIVPPGIAVGTSLQASTTIGLTEPAPSAGMTLTLTSSDPTRLLFSRSPDVAGTGSVQVLAGPSRHQSQEFWVQARGDAGSVKYAVSSPDLPPATGVVTVAPSGVIVVGPLQGPSFRTTSGARPSRIQVQSVMLDPSSSAIVAQAVAPGPAIEVNLTNSNEGVGRLANSRLTIGGGASVATTMFEPAAPGETTLTVVVPRGFTRSEQFAAVTAIVTTPGIGLVGDSILGKNLQVRGVATLGEFAPAGGVTLALTSDDPTQLLLSTTATDVGSKTIQLKVPAGTNIVYYYIQSLGDSGQITYRASAPGYRDRSGTVTLTPSGVLLTPARQGPPAATELSSKDAIAPRRLVTSVKGEGEALAVWTARLDPKTHRGADGTIQPLRAGVDVTVVLQNANPVSGTVPASVTIAGGSERALAPFVPLSPGSTVLSIITPDGFTTSSNAAAVTAVVQP